MTFIILIVSSPDANYMISRYLQWAKNRRPKNWIRPTAVPLNFAPARVLAVAAASHVGQAVAEERAKIVW